MSSGHLASLALEYWRASGVRTLARLESLVVFVAAAYHGPEATWAPIVRELVSEGYQTACRHTRAWEVTN
jgi:hypothetical protein